MQPFMLHFHLDFFFSFFTFGKPGRGGNNVGDVSILRELGGRSKCC